MAEVTFLTNHARVLICLAESAGQPLRQVADCAGLTERTTHRLVDDLVEAGYLTRHRLGTRSFYELHADRDVSANELPRNSDRDPLSVGTLLRPVLERSRRARQAGDLAVPPPSDRPARP